MQLETLTIGAREKSARWVKAGFLVAMLIFVAIAVATYTGVHAYLANSDRVRTCYEFQQELTGFASSLKDIQRGARGYVITGHPAFLEPFREGSDTVRQDFALLQRTAQPDTLQGKKIKALETLSDRLMQVTQQEVEFVRGGEPDSARELVRNGEAKRAMDEIDIIVRRMINDQTSMLAERQAEGESDLRELLVFLVLGSGLNFGLIIGLFLLMNRQLRARQTLADTLRRSEQKLQTVINSIQEGITFSNAKGGFEVYNHRMKEMTGYTMEEANRAGDFSRLLYPDPADHQRALEGVRLVIEQPGPHVSESIITTRSGQKRVIRASSQLLGRPERRMFLTTYEDVTEARKTEQLVRESEERYRTLFEATPVPIGLYDVETLEFLHFNPAALEHYGYTMDEILRMKITDIIPEEDLPLLRSVLAAQREISFASGAWRHRKKDGSIINVSITSHALGWMGHKARMVIVHDVTEREQLIGQLQKALADVKTLSGLVPICAWCKKIRDDQGYYHQIESYLAEHSEATFTHGICPDCLAHLNEG